MNNVLIRIIINSQYFFDWKRQEYYVISDKNTECI